MKRIIDKKIYDTDKATIVFAFNRNQYREGTDLYVTKHGNFFKFNWSMYQGAPWGIEAISRQEAFEYFCEIADTDNMDSTLAEFFPNEIQGLEEA